MKKVLLSYILTTICFSTLAFAQSQQDAMDLSKGIFNTLCSGKKISVPVKRGATEKEKRIAALNFVKSVVTKSSPYYQSIRTTLDKVSIDGGAGGWLSFFNSKDKPLLRQFLACSPIDKFVDYVEIDEGFEDVVIPYENFNRGGCEWGFHKNKVNVCERFCPTGRVMEVVNILHGEAVPFYTNYVSFGFICVSCSDTKFSSRENSDYSLTSDSSNECFNPNNFCAEGSEKISAVLTKEVYDNMSSLQNAMGALYITDESLLYNDDMQKNVSPLSPTVHAEFCAPKCRAAYSRDPVTGACLFSRENACNFIANNKQRFEAFDISYFKNMSSEFPCSGNDAYALALQKKANILKQFEEFANLCATQVDGDFMYTYTQKPAVLESPILSDDDLCPIENGRGSDDDIYNLARPIFGKHN